MSQETEHDSRRYSQDKPKSCEFCYFCIFCRKNRMLRHLAYIRKKAAGAAHTGAILPALDIVSSRSCVN